MASNEKRVRFSGKPGEPFQAPGAKVPRKTKAAPVTPPEPAPAPPQATNEEAGE